jgi:DNA-directed RNA polymerase specialized sigma24 family protein
MELAFDTVQESVVKFRDRVLKRNRWNPAKGATLKTFFIGFCLFIFPNFYRSWLVSWHNPANSDTRDPVLDPLPLPTDPESRTEEVALARALLADVQDKVDEVTLGVLRLRVERYTFKEIGEILGISEARAKTLAHRYRPQHG